MTVRTVVCPECGVAVPYGRLSCAECGSLLASVVGSSRRLDTRPVEDRPSRLEPDPDPTLAIDAVPPETRSTHEPPAWPEVDARAAPVEREERSPTRQPSEPPAPAKATAAGVPAAPERRAEPTSRAPRSRPTAPVLPDWEGALPAAIMSEPAPPAAPGPTVSPPSVAPAVSPPAVSPPALSAPPPLARAEPTRPVAGTYLAPTAEWVAQKEAPAVAPAKRERPGDAPILADLPFDPPDDLPGWLVVAGGALASVSFLLPWATQLVIGGTLDRGYFGRWGLASPAAILLLLAALATFVLGIVPNPIPAWLRTGLLPLTLGGVLLGLVWAYLVGPFGAAIGVWTVAFGAALFLLGGILALHPWRAERHDTDEPSV